MDLLIVGLNHRTAPISLREQVAFDEDQLGLALPALHKDGNFREVAILSTCNRTETIAVGDSLDPAVIINWLAEYHKIPVRQLQDSTYIHWGYEAVHHAMNVACGLDSMVLGEPQILGQFKDCFRLAERYDTMGPDLNNLAQSTNQVAKKVRTDTGIGENPVSVASIAVTLAERLFADITTCNVLLIGAGDIIELLATLLANAGVNNLVIANRTLANAERLAEVHGARPVNLNEVPQLLATTDIVISSTGSRSPLLRKDTVEQALKSRRHKPIFMVDLAVPRDIEPEVSTLRDVYLYSIDDLQNIISENLALRQDSAREALQIIENEVARFTENFRSLDAVDTLVMFRDRHEQLKQEELESALQRLKKGHDPEEVLSAFANRLTSRITHVPTLEIKDAGAHGRNDLLAAIKHLFRLDHKE